MNHLIDHDTPYEHPVRSSVEEPLTRPGFDAGTLPSQRERFSAQPSDLVRSPAGHARLLRPQLRSDLIERPSRYPRSERPFVLVVAPAGAGKTTLVAQWLASSTRISTWLTLDAADNDLSLFIRHLVATIRRVDPSVGRSALGALRLPEQPPAELIGNLLTDDLHLVARDFVVVIDDFDRVNSDDIRRFLIPLVRYPAPQVTFVLVSRVDPALPFARLRSKGELEEIRAEQLRLTKAESGALLRRVVGQHIRDVDLTELLEHCEGWAAGLHLAGLALRDATDPVRVSDMIRLHGERNSLEFLFDEVFSLLPANVQAFLGLTSCVDPLNASLSDALLWEPDAPVDSASILKWLVDQHIYLTPLSNDNGWYRYQPVFRRLLSRQLESRYGAEIVHRLLARARDWFDEHGFVAEGIAYSLAVDEPIIACDIVKRRAQTALVEGNWSQLEDWLDALPSDMVERDPDLVVLRAWGAWLRGRNAEASRLVTHAKTQLTETMPPERNVAGLQAELDCIDVNLRWILDEPAAQVRMLERAFANLPAGHDFARALAVFRLGMERAWAGNRELAIQLLYQSANNPESTTAVTQLALGGLVWIYLFHGETMKAATAADRLLRLLADLAPSPFSTGWAHWMAGAVAYERNDLERAAKLLETAVSNREAIPFTGNQDSLFLLASIYQRNGQIKEADTLLENLLSLAESINFAGAMEIARAYAALFAYQRGNLTVAYRWLDRVVQELPFTPPAFSLPTQLIMARLLIERGSPRDLELASNVTFRIERLYSSTVLPTKRALQIFVLRSMIEERLGNRLMADEFMNEAMALMRPHGFVRTLIELGSPVLSILYRLRPSDLREKLIAALEAEGGQPIPSTEQADTLTAEAVLPPSTEHRARGPLPETLTSRELEVLELLRQRLSNREIAEALFISPQTVKRHNSNIFNKLGVSSRRQAMRRSEEIGLLPVDDSDQRTDFPSTP